MLNTVLVNLRIAGVLFGILVFILGNVLVSAAPDIVHDALKPILCADGYYNSVQPNGTHSTDCVQPNGQRYNIDSQQFVIIVAASAVPILATWGFAWAILFFRPRGQGLSERGL